MDRNYLNTFVFVKYYFDIFPCYIMSQISLKADYGRITSTVQYSTSTVLHS